MDETFIENAFIAMGESCLTVKLIKNKITRSVAFSLPYEAVSKSF